MDSALIALSPLDGRYQSKLTSLSAFFSELAFMRYRVQVEVEYLLALAYWPIPEVAWIRDNQPLVDFLKSIYENFDINDAKRVKVLEQQTNHDVKALEYFLREKIETATMITTSQKQNLFCFIHFGLTSQDVNNTAVPLMFQAAMTQVYLPQLNLLTAKFIELGKQWQAIPMLSRTHGQAASPTTLGKELLVFGDRLQKLKKMLLTLDYYGKFGGATGNFNAHAVAYPDVNWPAFGDHFLSHYLGLKRLQITTQIDQYDWLATFFDVMRQINVVLIDACRDFWTYISLGYFKLQIKAGEVGSSAMPHKVNPIDFEQAEGNFGLANAIFDHLSNKLPVSRLQRDLTDSTVLRNIGVPIGHTVLGLISMLGGMNKLAVNQPRIAQDLDAHPEVLAEALQTVLRKAGIPDAYEQLKALTRFEGVVTIERLRDFIRELNHPALSNVIKKQLLEITPADYTGFAAKFPID